MLDYTEKCFPPDWLILSKQAFDSTEAGDKDELTGQILLNVNSQGVLHGNFRFVLGGSSTLGVNLKLKNVIQSEAAKDFYIKLEIDPKDIQFRVNSLTTDWFDLQER